MCGNSTGLEKIKGVPSSRTSQNLHSANLCLESISKNHRSLLLMGHFMAIVFNEKCWCRKINKSHTHNLN